MADDTCLLFFDALIARSSLGEHGVKLIRAGTPCALAKEIVLRSETVRDLSSCQQIGVHVTTNFPAHGDWQKEESTMSKSTRNTGTTWSAPEESQLRQQARQNTPTRVIGLKLGRTETAVRSRASQMGVSLTPTNQSPYNRRSR